MQITGFQIREAIKRHVLRRDTSDRLFKLSLFAFAGEDKKKPQAVMLEYATADNAIAALQDLQQKFNHATKVKVGDKEMPLSMAVKLVGGAGRQEKQWRTATLTTGRGYRDDEIEITRSQSEHHATKQVTVDEAVALANTAAELAGQFRAAISEGNLQTIEVTDAETIKFLKG